MCVEMKVILIIRREGGVVAYLTESRRVYLRRVKQDSF